MSEMIELLKSIAADSGSIGQAPEGAATVDDIILDGLYLDGPLDADNTSDSTMTSGGPIPTLYGNTCNSCDCYAEVEQPLPMLIAD